MIGSPPVFIDTRDNFTIKGTVFKDTESLWELLTRKNVNSEVINMAEIKTKKIVLMTNALLNIYQRGVNINITRGKKFRDIIAPLFAKQKGRGVESTLRLK